MQKHSEPSSFLANSTRAPYSEEDGLIALASNSSSNYFLISNYSWGLYLYIDFCMGLVPSSRGISCTSPRFWLGGTCVGSMPGNMPWYLHNTIHNDVLYFSSTLSKCGIAPFRRSPSPYKISYKNKMGLPDVFNYLLYVILDPLMDPSGNLYLTSIILASRFFWICIMCSTSVTHIISPMYNVCGASRRWNRFCLCLLSAVVHSKTYTCSFVTLWLFTDGELCLLIHLWKCFSPTQIINKEIVL